MSDLYVLTGHTLSAGEECTYFGPDFEWFYDSALQVLKNRSKHQIAKLIWDVDVTSVESVPWVSGELTPESVLNNPIEIYPGRLQAIKIQHLIARGNSADSISDLDNLTWAECVAAALLGHVMFAQREEKRLLPLDFRKEPEHDYYFDLGELMGRYAVSCMELLSVLAMLPDHSAYNLPRGVITQKATSTAKKAAGSRHAPANEIKKSFIKWFEANQQSGLFHSQNQAADRYLRDHIGEEKKRYVSTPNTLIRALREHRKAK